MNPQTSKEFIKGLLFFDVVVVFKGGNKQGLSESSWTDEEGVSVIFQFLYNFGFIDIIIVFVSDCFKVTNAVGYSFFHGYHHRGYYSIRGVGLERD